MGSMIHLAVGRLEVDWGKNSGFTDHSALFQMSDVANVPYTYVQEDSWHQDENGESVYTPIIKYKEGLSKPLAQVVDRMALLGHTFAQCPNEFAFFAQLNGFDTKTFTFKDLVNALAIVDVKTISPDYGEGGEDFGKFFRRQIAPRIGIDLSKPEYRVFSTDIGLAMENLSAYTVLHLIAQNPPARDLPVTWQFSDLETGDWARRDDFVKSLDPSNRFLIVTEGSSDAAIIKQALRLLRPHIADFFDFVDMEEGYPFSGTGNVFKFVQGLISISVQNNVLVLFDNDAEGVANHQRCLGLNVPDNMAILKLPDCKAFKKFDTIGPGGSKKANINGCAAAIECYLDLDDGARVRWTSFNQKLGVYQGELERKTDYAREFLKQRKRKDGYDYTRIDALLATIFNAAVAMAERVVAREWARELNNADG